MLHIASSPTYPTARDLLADELAFLDLLLARHVARLRATGRFTEDPFRGLHISESDADATLAADEWSDTALDHRIASRRAMIDGAIAASIAAGLRLPLESLARKFGLDDFGAGCLLIAAAASFDRRYETLFAYANNDVARKLASVDLVLDLLAPQSARLDCLAHFRPEAPLVRDRLIVFAENEREMPLPGRSLRVEDRVADALLDLPAQMDARLASFLRCEPADPVWLDPAATAAADASLVCCRHEPSAIVLAGPDDCGQRSLVEALCRKRGLRLIEASMAHPAALELPPERLGQLLAREAIMSDAGLLLAAGPQLPAGRCELVASAAARPGLPLFVAAAHGFDTRIVTRSVTVERCDMPRATAEVRGRWWRSLIGAHALNETAAAGAARLGVTFHLGPNGIAESLRIALRERSHDGSDKLTVDHLATAARRHAAQALPRLARRVEPHCDWSDLVLPGRQIEQLREISAWVELWSQVHGDWGFKTKMPQGHATAALFCGPSGTGKTMAASVVARTVGLDLFRIDLASVVSKYIGETEQNIDRLFDEAMRANAILFFDEADALFGKRTEVRDAHDRYANLEVSYLLQRIEDHEGLVILATNLNGNIDDAFARRLRHIVAFPFPDAGLRTRLWRQAFPAEAPLDAALDLPRIAQNFELSGGNIRNAALAAAFLAASERRAIETCHLMRAIAREFEKLGRPPNGADFGELRGVLDGDDTPTP